jgi:hypothetical protein
LCLLCLLWVWRLFEHSFFNIHILGICFVVNNIHKKNQFLQKTRSKSQKPTIVVLILKVNKVNSWVNLNLNLNYCNKRLTSLSRLSMQLSTNPEGKAYHSNPHLNTKLLFNICLRINLKTTTPFFRIFDKKNFKVWVWFPSKFTHIFHIHIALRVKENTLDTMEKKIQAQKFKMEDESNMAAKTFFSDFKNDNSSKKKNLFCCIF